MEYKEKLTPLTAAQHFISTYFPDCDGAVLAGSVVRGEATETSDLDIVIFNKNSSASYRESLIYAAWPIEAFVHNLTTYKDFFQSDCERARPSLPRMIAEGIILKGEQVINPIKREAKDLLDKGAEPWSASTIRTKRYFITDSLEDFQGSTDRAEELFIANTLAELLSEFVLRTNRKWIGTSKWVIRALKQHDADFADSFVKVFDNFYKTGVKDEVIVLTDSILEPHGGRLFDGFSLGKQKDKRV